MHRKLIGPLAQLREAALRSQSKCERKLYSAIESGRLFGGKEAALDAAQERFVACCLADGANWAALRGLQGNLLALLAERDTELRASCSKAVSDAATTGYKPGDRLPKIVRALVHDALADSKALLDARVDFDSQDMTTRGLVAAAVRAASLAGLDVGVDDDDDGEDVNIVHASFYDSPEAVAAVMNQQVAALTRLQDRLAALRVPPPPAPSAPPVVYNQVAVNPQIHFTGELHHMSARGMTTLQLVTAMVHLLLQDRDVGTIFMRGGKGKRCKAVSLLKGGGALGELVRAVVAAFATFTPAGYTTKSLELLVQGYITGDARMQPHSDPPQPGNQIELLLKLCGLYTTQRDVGGVREVWTSPDAAVSALAVSPTASRQTHWGGARNSAAAITALFSLLVEGPGGVVLPLDAALRYFVSAVEAVLGGPAAVRVVQLSAQLTAEGHGLTSTPRAFRDDNSQYIGSNAALSALLRGEGTAGATSAAVAAGIGAGVVLLGGASLRTALHGSAPPECWCGSRKQPIYGLHMSIQGHGAQDLGRGHHGVAYIPCRHGQRQGGAGVGWRLVRQSLYTYLHTHLQP